MTKAREWMRIFAPGTIPHEAGKEIERLDAEIRRLQAELDRLNATAVPMMIAHTPEHLLVREQA